MFRKNFELIVKRKEFIKVLFSSISLLLIYLWNKLIENIYTHNQKRKAVLLTTDLSNGITIKEDFIIVKDDKKIKVLSTKCTHLGCRINNFQNGMFTCPCHGSQYDLDGNVTKGPAIKNLTELNFNTDKLKNQITISL